MPCIQRLHARTHARTHTPANAKVTLTSRVRTWLHRENRVGVVRYKLLRLGLFFPFLYSAAPLPFPIVSAIFESSNGEKKKTWTHFADSDRLDEKTRGKTEQGNLESSGGEKTDRER